MRRFAALAALVLAAFGADSAADRASAPPNTPASASVAGPVTAEPGSGPALVPVALSFADDAEFCLECTQVLHWGRPRAGAGSFVGVDLPRCDRGPCGPMLPAGAGTLRCLLANGYTCAIATGQALDPARAALVAPCLAGLGDRWDADSDQREDIRFSSYTGNGARLMRVPVTTEPPPGHGAVTVLGIAWVFLTARPPATVSGALEVEHLPEGLAPTSAASWGALKTRFRR